MVRDVRSGGGVLPAGALVALATPMTSGGEVDPAGLERLVDRVRSGGVAGISPCGSTGEGARLSLRQRLEVVGLVVDAASGTPVIAGVPTTSLREARHELVELGGLGVTAALVPPPSYFPSTDAELESMYRALADESPVPIVLYNIPSFAHTVIAPAVAGRLAAHERIAGIKDSSRDLEYLQAVIAATKGPGADGFTVYTGTDTMLVASLLAGADGAIAGSANLVPALGVRLVEAIASDLALAGQLQRQIAAIVSVCRVGSPPAGWKAALELAGVCSSALVPPAQGLSAEQIESVRQGLAAVEEVGGAEPEGYV